MQIACYELYEKEKKENEGKPIGVLYHQVYKLGDDPCLRYHKWKYTNFIFDSTVENILVYFHYRTEGMHEDGGFGRIEYDFYVVENDGNYYIRYFDMWDVESKASECGKSAISNVAWCNEGIVGTMTKEYQEFVRNECMSEKISIDKTELEEQLDKIANTDFSDSFIDCLGYKYRSTHLEMLDFRNKVTFHVDEFVLDKYSGCIEFVEYVFSKCNIPCLSKCNLRFTDSIQKAEEEIVERTIKRKYHIW